MKNLFFFHGMESSPKGTKAALLKKHYPDSTIPQLPPDLVKRDWIIEDLVKEPSWLVGSSLGGLSAILYAMKQPGMVKGMILLAPAVGFFTDGFFTQEDRNRIQTAYIPEGISTTILAGKRDEVIPLFAIEEMIERSPEKKRIKLIKLDDDHSLNQFPDLLVDLIKKMLD
jgi:Serine aminopeptidase, S33